MNPSTSSSFTIGRRRVLVSAAAAAAALGTKGAFAQSAYPNRPIKLIHAFAAGSGTDNTGRVIAERLAQRLGQPVVVENKPGANMIIGSEYAAKQPADGYTLIMVTLDNLGINPSLYRNPGYSVKDFDPLTLIGTFPLALMSATGFKYNNLKELRAAAAASGQPFNFGTWGIGSVAHLYGELIKAETGIPLNFIPFQGAAPAVAATLAGHVDLTLSSAFTFTPHSKAGKAKALAIGGNARHPEMPQVATFTEQGFPDVGAIQWHGIAVRAGGNRAIIDKLYAALKDVMSEPDTKEKILKTGYTAIDGRPPAEFAFFINAEAVKWERIVKASGVTSER
jgi:tripartite-type tricarboxylate transporter receptor subunit TctC